MVWLYDFWWVSSCMSMKDYLFAFLQAYLKKRQCAPSLEEPGCLYLCHNWCGTMSWFNKEIVAFHHQGVIRTLTLRLYCGHSGILRHRFSDKIPSKWSCAWLRLPLASHVSHRHKERGEAISSGQQCGQCSLEDPAQQLFQLLPGLCAFPKTFFTSLYTGRHLNESLDWNTTNDFRTHEQWLWGTLVQYYGHPGMQALIPECGVKKKRWY